MLATQLHHLIVIDLLKTFNDSFLTLKITFLITVTVIKECLSAFLISQLI